MKKLKITLLYIVISAIIGCAPKQTNDINTFTISNASEPSTLDPAKSSTVDEARIINAIFEGLTTLSPKESKPIAGLAKCVISADKKSYTFTLKSDLKWNNGTPLTAEDFVYSWRRVLTPATAANNAQFLFDIVNAKAFYNQTVSDFSKVGIKAISPTKLEVKLIHPNPNFLEFTSLPTFLPVNRTCIEQFGNRWTSPKNIVSNGAFKLDEWIARKQIKLVKSEEYHDAKQVKLATIIFYPHDNLETAYRLFLNGKVDWLTALPIEKASEIKYNPDYYLFPALGTYFYRFNCTKPPFNNPQVRRALAHAVNREQITSKILGNGELPTTSFCPPIGDYIPTEGVDYDIVKAKSLLAEAGYNDENKFPDFEIFYNNSEAHKKIAESICEQWRTNLAINVTLRNSEWKTFLDDQKSLNYDISRSSWIGDYPDPINFLEIFVANSPNNRTGWADQKYAKLLEVAKLSTDNTKRLKLLNSAEDILLNQACVIIPINYYMNRGLISENVMGWHENLLDRHPLKYIYKIIDNN